MIRLRFLNHIVLCGSLLLPVAGLAEQEKQPTISASLYKKLQKTDQLIADKAYDQAGNQLRALLNEVKTGSYEEVAVLRSLSSVYALKEHYSQAAEYLSKALSLKVLPDKQEQQAILSLGQLYLAAGQHAKAIQTLKPWLARNPIPDAETNVMIANAYTQLKQYRNALPYINKAIQATPKPVESWYQMQLALYYELNDYQSAARTLQKLIRFYPGKKDYWVQLASLYQHAKKYNHAATIKNLAYRKGLLDSEKDILDLANLYSYIGSPYKAGTLLKNELETKRLSANSKNWELLADAWTQAREYDNAIEALKIAASLNDKGSLYLQLGQIYFEQEKWGLAIAALKKALAKGGLKDPGNAYLMLGMSYFESKKKAEARHAFAAAGKYPKNRKTANQWLNYLDE
ncbi:MAG: tetratricopeptide repeat protein [Gammaproteobacteria bacterium]